MPTMITNLPRDLMEDILLRIPLKSMRAVRLTCKEWNNLSKSPSFTKMHFGKTSATTKEGESRMILIMKDSLYLVSVFVNDVDLSTEHKGKLTCLNEQVKISYVFHCDGLLLCILKDDDNKVVIFPHPRCGPVDRFGYALGYENKKSRRNNKLLRFIDRCLFTYNNEFVWYKIYDFDSDLWKTLEFITPYWHIHLTYQGYYEGYSDHIICFDFTREKFGPLLRLPFSCSLESFVTLSCIREEKIAALSTNEGDPDCFERWMTTMIEPQKVLWSKFLAMNARQLDVMPISPDFFIDDVKNVAMGFDVRLNRFTVNIIGEAGSVGQVDLKERTEECRYRPSACSYVPSLVEIKKPKGGQRKEQSILEKHRYVQKLLRLSVFKWRIPYTVETL
ncbi:hypothetical protein EUTSA_v10015464mg [Eutrema salsugineum]|uniref:F-box domain-containing protein n=1 Tax=Eutrema salsugineum TaxID=72664 RepID=V4KZZ8_EUTSA|nr:hypothetical protein EUTSA_v10015464mg [Eutrema salsugineum]